MGLIGINYEVDIDTKIGSFILQKGDYGFTVKASLTDGENIIHIPQGATAEVIWLKGNKKQVHNSATINGNVVSFVVSKAMTSASGEIFFNIIIYGDGWQKASKLIRGLIQENAHDDSDINNSHEFGILEIVINEARTATSAANNAADKANTAATKAEEIVGIGGTVIEEARKTLESATASATKAKEDADRADNAANKAESFAETAKLEAEESAISASNADISAKQASSDSIAAANSATTAAASALLSDTKAAEASLSASAASASALTSKEEAEKAIEAAKNAKASENQAKTSENNASLSSTAAAASALEAKASAEAASLSSTAAAASALKAGENASFVEEYAMESKKWAVGNEPDDTTNSKYYAEQAKQAADLASQVSKINLPKLHINPATGHLISEQETGIIFSIDEKGHLISTIE